MILLIVKFHNFILKRTDLSFIPSSHSKQHPKNQFLILSYDVISRKLNTEYVNHSLNVPFPSNSFLTSQEEAKCQISCFGIIFSSCQITHIRFSLGVFWAKGLRQSQLQLKERRTQTPQIITDNLLLRKHVLEIWEAKDSKLNAFTLFQLRYLNTLELRA